MDDSAAYKMWWIALAYGAGPEARMRMLDNHRSKHVPT